MGTLSFWHILVVVVVVAVVFGHRRIPAFLGALGSLIGQIRNATKPKRHPPDDIIEGTYVRRDD
jgi:TatA/E family protein of Tat protein translocase